MSPLTDLNSNEKGVESLDDGRCKNRCKLIKKRWPILLILIGITLVVGVPCAVVYYPKKPAEISLQQQHEDQDKTLQDLGCSPKPEVMNISTLLSKEDVERFRHYEIDNWLTAIFQCNDNRSFCGANGNCTCEPTENGQTNATAIIKFRDPNIKNSKWQYEQVTLNTMKHLECVAKAL